MHRNVLRSICFMQLGLIVMQLVDGWLVSSSSSSRRIGIDRIGILMSDTGQGPCDYAIARKPPPALLCRLFVFSPRHSAIAIKSNPSSNSLISRPTRIDHLAKLWQSDKPLPNLLSNLHQPLNLNSSGGLNNVLLLNTIIL